MSQGTCRSCGASVLWATTPRGKKCPMDQLPLAEGAEVPKNIIRWRLVSFGKRLEAVPAKFGEVAADLHLSHFATCPNAREHSRKGKS